MRMTPPTLDWVLVTIIVVALALLLLFVIPQWPGLYRHLQ